MHPRPAMLPILLLAFALPAQAAQAARTADPDWLAPLMARLAAIAQRRADFTEIRHFAALTTDLRSQGWLVYQRPDLLEKMTTAPTREELIVRGDDLRDRAADQAERIVSLSSQPVVAALVDAVRGPLSGDLAGLRGYYQVTASGSAADWHLALLPRAAALRDLLRGIAIDGGGTDITRIAITEAKGDTDIMTITPAP